MTLAPERTLVHASVVIPAHNEAAVLPRCLRALADQPCIDECEVVVVANGCTDRTVEVARSFAPVIPLLRVVELEVSGKVAALNAGDRVASGFPRIYLDADIALGQGALEPLIDSLRSGDPRVASPGIDFDLEGSSRPVRSFYRIFSEMPYVRDGLVGLGVYGVSATGRARFGEFPDVIADDLFVQRCFRDDERTTTEGRFSVLVPRNLRELVKVRSRVSRGNRELAERPDQLAATTDVVDSDRTSNDSVLALARMALSRPDRILAVLVYVAVTVLSRIRARRTTVAWERDDSTRGPAHDKQRVPRIVLDGLAISALDHDGVVDHVMSCLEAGEGGLIMTPNVDHMQKLHRGRRDVGFPREAIIGACDLVVPDGMPLVWASRIQGTPLPGRITGADLVWSLSRAAARQGRSVYLLGGAEGVGERAAEAFAVGAPGLRVAGSYSPPMGFQNDDLQMARLTADLRAAAPDIVFVALGFPKQELLADRLRQVLPGAWFLGCGGALDMAAGDMRRASGLAQRLGLEWVHRLVLEPRRLARRYLVEGIPFAVGLLARAALRRLTGVHATRA